MTMTTTLPSDFKSLTYTTPSTPPHLSYFPLIPPGPNELLVKIKAASINPVDLQFWHSPLIGFLAGKKEKGIGRDYAGTVIGVGKDVKGWAEGEEVFGMLNRPTGEGTFSEYIKVLPSDPIARKPACWSFEEAAAVPLVALTAFACLDWLPAESEELGKRRVVVAGASGGVGIWCLQLAKKLYNCHITGICSSKNADFVRGMGADEVIDYTTQDVAKALLDARPRGRKFDLYIDCVGGVEIFKHWHDLLHRNAAFITIVGDKTSRTSLGGPTTYFTSPSQLARFVKGWLFGPRYATIMFSTKSELLEQAAELADRGEVQVVIQEVIKGVLDEGNETWKQCFEHMKEGRVRGKIVVDID